MTSSGWGGRVRGGEAVEREPQRGDCQPQAAHQVPAAGRLRSSIRSLLPIDNSARGMRSPG